MLPAQTSHLGFETTVTFAEEKMCLFMSKLRGEMFILITVTLQDLCKQGLLFRVCPREGV